MDLLHASPAALVEAGFAGGHVPTEGTREAADAQLKICCFFPDGLWLVEPTKMSLVPGLDGTRGTPAISW